MRHSALAVSATVLFGIGMVTARVGAQAVPAPLSQRVQIDITKRTPAQSLDIARRALEKAVRGHELGDADNPLRQPLDCGMPVLKGDPAVDPEIVKQPPHNGVKHTMKVIKVVPCPSRR